MMARFSAICVDRLYDGESNDEAVARYESELGLRGERNAVMWISTGVPCGDSSLCV